MLNFNSFFNQWRTQPSNGLNQLIDSPNITLGRLLDQEQFLSQYKSGNIKVAEFMKYQRYEEMIDFVTVVGPPEDKKRSYKYPLTASQLLSMENANANYLELFLPEKPIILETKTFENVQQQVEVQIDEPQPPKIQNKSQNNQNCQPKEEGQEKKTTSQAVGNAEEVGKEGQTKPEDIDIEQKQNKKQQNQKPQDTVEPQVKEKKKIKVKSKVTKRVERIVKEEKPALILKLLSYFKAGYVSKILGFLLTKRPVEFFKYALEENTIHQIINHAQSRSVGQLIIKMLTNQTTHSLQTRQSFLKHLFARLSVQSEIYVISNLSTYVCEMIEKVAANMKNNNKLPEVTNIFFSLEVFTKIIKNVMSQEESVSVYNAPILFTYLTNFPLVIPHEQTLVQTFKMIVQHFIQKSCQKLQVKHRNRPKLGGGRIKLLQILRFLLKQNLLSSKDIVASKKQFFPTLLNLMKEYEMNNVLHNQVVKVLQIALAQPQGSALNNSLLSDNFLVNFISSEAEEDKRIRAGGSIYKSRKGYIAHVINLALRLKQLSSSNENIKTLFQNDQFANIYDGFIEKQNINTKKSLAGFTFKKDIKHEIMFQKEDIITAYLKFFQKCPNAIFEPQQKQEEQVNIEHPDLVQELQKQLEENLSVKSKEESQSSAISENEKSKEAPSENQPSKEEEANGKEWTNNLQYHIDELVSDL